MRLSRGILEYSNTGMFHDSTVSRKFITWYSSIPCQHWPQSRKFPVALYYTLHNFSSWNNKFGTFSLFFLFFFELKTLTSSHLDYTFLFNLEIDRTSPYFSRNILLLFLSKLRLVLVDVVSIIQQTIISNTIVDDDYHRTNNKSIGVYMYYYWLYFILRLLVGLDIFGVVMV